MLPVPLCGPILGAEIYCRYTCVGPSLMLKNTANTLVWALPDAEKYCQYTCMGPSLKLKITADTLAWAHP